MNHAEKRMLIEAHREVRQLRARVDVLTELVGLTLNRKAGRPSRQEAERVDQLKAQMYGNQ